RRQGARSRGRERRRGRARRGPRDPRPRPRVERVPRRRLLARRHLARAVRRELADDRRRAPRRRPASSRGVGGARARTTVLEERDQIVRYRIGPPETAVMAQKRSISYVNNLNWSNRLMRLTLDLRWASPSVRPVCGCPLDTRGRAV